MIKIPKCDRCDKPATSFTRDMIESNDGMFISRKPTGKPRLGCDEHPPEPGEIFRNSPLANEVMRMK